MYKSKLNIKETQKAIQSLKKNFQALIQEKLNLTRATAPLFLLKESGLNDGLNGEAPVSFSPKEQPNIHLEIVHSLAKWKRHALKQYNYLPGEGIYTDMNAVRREEDLDFTHSYYVDQWDWEVIINKSDRNIDFLHNVVKKIYSALYQTKENLVKEFSVLENNLPKEIFFISSQELEDLYPAMTLEEREDAIVREKGAVFISKIGYKLKSGLIHSLRAFDYDDWNLNGDLLVYSKVHDKAIEISSMGIRVDQNSIVSQSNKTQEEVKNLSPYHKAIIKNTLPLTIGGGIGQSRVSMFLLEKKHIGEVQASFWPENYRNELKEQGIELL